MFFFNNKKKTENYYDIIILELRRMDKLILEKEKLKNVKN